ncbi:uncharacterized protein LOC111370089 [Olea europaea var. sylvestris]|uniref:uncharacterized protein LOC111370089 n=1 Tax=Olea europaea var. sylvestris TaxID=158386 RepID=UPI000C1D2239|nr:uncharacterized protein LOC111370089 [Olea europaea var. sylvestris]
MTRRAPNTLPSNIELNPREHVLAITTRTGIQLPERHIERSGVNNETAPSTEKEIEQQDEQTSESTLKESSKTSWDKRLRKHKKEQQYKKFLEIFEKLYINIPFADALLQMPSYAKFLKDILTNKCKLEEHEMVILIEECSARIQKKLPPKLKDTGSFTVHCRIGDFYFNSALCDLGASINLMPLSVFRKLGLGELKATTVTLQPADRSPTHPRGIIEDVLVKVDKLIFSADFLILDMEEDNDASIILRRPFLATTRALINVQQGQLILRLGEEKVSFNGFKVMKYPNEPERCFHIEVVDRGIPYNFELKK